MLYCWRPKFFLLEACALVTAGPQADDNDSASYTCSYVNSAPATLYVTLQEVTVAVVCNNLCEVC